MGGLDVVHELVGLILSHLAAAHHVLHEISCTFDGECGQPSGGSDDIAHRCRHLAPGLEGDFVRLGRHFGHGVTNVLAAMPGATLRRCGRRGGSLVTFG